MTLPATDSFTRSDAANLGANWTNDIASGDPIRLRNYYAAGTAGGPQCTSAYWNADAFPNDQYAQATIAGAIGPHPYSGVMVRGGSGDGVMLEADLPNTRWDIYWYHAGAYTAIGSAWGTAPALADVGKITVEGTTYTGYVNGSSRISGSNASAPSAGSAGLWIYGTATDRGLDDWSGGSMAATGGTRLDARWLNFWNRGQTWYHFWQDAAAVVQGQIIPVGQAAETDLARAIVWAPKNRLVGKSTETDLAQAVLRAKVRAIGQAADTELGQAVTRVKRRAIGQAAETDLAQALFKRKVKIVGEPSEADAAQVVGRRKSVLIGQSFETDLAQTITEAGATVVPIGQAAEVDVGLSIVRATGGEEPPPPPVQTGVPGWTFGMIDRYFREKAIRQEEEELVVVL